MFSYGRWLMMACLATGLVACGGGSDPLDKVEHQTFVSVSVNGVTEDSTIIVDADGDAVTQIGSLLLDKFALTFTGGLPEILKADDITIDRIANVPYDGTEEQLYSVVRLQPFLEFFNNSLSTIPFDLNEGVAGVELDGVDHNIDFGYDFLVRNVPTDGSEPTVYWSTAHMLKWCVEELNNTEFNEEEFTTETDYDAPTELLAAETWSPGEDDRYKSCPSTILINLVFTWNGRTMEDIKDKIAAIEEQQIDFDDADGEDDSEDRVPPTFVQAVEAVLTDDEEVPLVDELQGDSGSAQFELLIDVNINDYVDAEPYVIPFTVNLIDIEDLDTE